MTAGGVEALDHARRTWLASAVAQLERDPRVRAVWAVGSIGRGDEDPWSDVDLVIITDASEVGDLLATPHETSRFGHVALPTTPWVALPFNGVVTYCSVTYAADGFPLWVDWHVHSSELRAPTEGTLLGGSAEVPGMTEVPILPGPTVRFETSDAQALERELELALVPVAAKWIARGAPSIASMLELVHAELPASTEWPDEMEALRSVVDRCRTSAPASSVELVERYLALVHDYRTSQTWNESDPDFT